MSTIYRNPADVAWMNAHCDPDVLRESVGIMDDMSRALTINPLEQAMMFDWLDDLRKEQDARLTEAQKEAIANYERAKEVRRAYLEQQQAKQQSPAVEVRNPRKLVQALGVYFGFLALAVVWWVWGCK